MIRNLKALGLALVTVFALGAVIASAASAQQGKLTSDGPVTLKIEERVVGGTFLEAFGLNVKCPESIITGHKWNVTPHVLIPSGETTGTLTPHWKEAGHNCRTNPGNFPTTIDMNGCDFDFHIGVTTPAGNNEGTYGITFDVTCPVGKEITVTVWTNTTDETKVPPVEPMCILHVPEQLGLTGAHIKNTPEALPKDDVDINGTVTGIKVKKTKTTHSLLCAASETTAGKFTLDATVTGLNAAGEPTGVTVTH